MSDQSDSSDLSGFSELSDSADLNRRNDSTDVFAGWVKEEPSVTVRRRVLAVARVRGATLRRRQRRRWLIPAALAAGALVAVTLTFAWQRVGAPRSGSHDGYAGARGAVESDAGASRLAGEPARPRARPARRDGRTAPAAPAGGQGAGAVSPPLGSLQRALAELRDELEFMESLAGGIPAGKFRGTGVNRGEVLGRVRARLDELRRLEGRVRDLSARAGARDEL